MTFSLIWLPQVLENAGLKVAEVPGWRTRGRARGVTLRPEIGLSIGCVYAAENAGK